MDERTLNDLLECSVCLDRLDTTSKVLPCQHTFCRKCLEVIVSSHSELRCPECRVLVDIKIDDLPPNVLLMRILEGMKNAITAANNLHVNNAIGPETVAQPMLNQSALNTNSSNNDFGVSINVCSRDQAKRTAPVSSEPIHRSMIKSNGDSLNAMRSNPARQPTQNAPTLNSNGQQTTGPSIPHAKALYDFDSREPGDLSFKKGDKIFLRRRIDVNWFVGETVGGREGVFPINYVQIIVPLAQPQCKALYDFKMGANEEEGCLTFKKGAIINVLRRVDQNWAEGRIDDTIGIFPIAFVEMNSLAKHVMDASAKYIHYAMTQRNVPPTPNEQQHSSFSSGSSSLTTSPVSPISSSTSTSSTGPSNALKNGQMTTQNNASLPSATASNTNKREPLNAPNSSNVASSNVSNGATHNSSRHSKDMQSNDKAKVPAQKHTKIASSMNKSCGSSKTNQRQRQNAQHVSVPANAYVALYPYKPQKSDELELKKGSIYFLKERCQDGWFRGVNRQQKSGVFPGNYVAPLRNINEHSNGSSASGGCATGSAAHAKRSAGSHSNASASKSTANPPELPPRSSGSSSSSSSSSSSVWSKPIGQHVEALFGRSQSSSTVNLIKRITNIKRSKSPVNHSTPAYSMDNPVFEDNTIGSTEPSCNVSKRNTIHLSHPQHVRSGSCPSQLLQSLPVDINLGPNAGTSGILNKAEMFGSHRIKPHKERTPLHQMTHGLAAANQTKSTESASPYHRKSQSLDAATIAAQLANGTSDANKRKSYTHNEKFKCIVSYPPNSDFELELSVGDIVYVHKKRDNGWYKGTHVKTGKVGLFPSSFVEPVI